MASPGKPRPIQERFESAVNVIRSLPNEGPFQPSNTVKLRFYALFKQVSNGPCDIPKPGFWDATGRAKWEAWSLCGQLSKELAMQMYTEELQRLVETMPQTKEVEAFLKSIGPFYEVADDVSDDEEQSHDSFDPTAQVSMETKSPPTPDKGDSPLGNEEDSNEVTNRNSSPTPTNQTSEPGEEIEGEGGGRESGDKVEGDDGEGGGGESGNESDSSVDFKDSFQDLKDETDGPKTPPTNVSQQRQLFTSSGPTVSRGIRQTNQTRSPVSHDKEQSKPAAVTRGSRSTRNVTFATGSLTQERGGIQTTASPGLSHSQGGTIHLSSPESYPLAIETVTSEISRLQINIQSMLQQLNTLALAVNGLTHMFQQSSGDRRTGTTTLSSSQLVPQLVTRRGRFLTLCIRSGPILIVWPIVVNIVMAYLVRRASPEAGPLLPSWIWGVFAILQAVFTLMVANKASR